MPTNLPPNPSANLVSMRLNEPYTSRANNKKLHGLMPGGVVRGGKLITAASGLLVTLEADADFGDSVYSYVDGDGNHLTFRQVGNVNIDLTPVASSTIYIASFIDYTISNPTTVEWRAYTLAELVTAPVAEAGEVIVLGRVVVPGAGPIAASAITPALRRVAWENISAGVTPWIQLVENGQWELAEETTVSLASADHIVAWQNSNLFAANYTWRIVTTAPLVGARELEILGDGASTEVQSMFGETQPIVRPGELIRVRFYIRGAVWGGIGASGFQGIQLNFYDSDKQIINTQIVSDPTLSGTFAYTLIDGIVEVPASAAFMCYAIRVDTDGATPSGSIFFDDIRVWKQSAQVLAESTRENMGFRTGVTGAAHIVPPFTLAADMDEAIEETLRIISQGATGGSVVSVLAKIMGTAGNSFDVNATKMGVQIQRRIKDLGSDLLSTSAETDTTRIEIPIGASGVTTRTLIWETKGTAHGNIKHRMYLTSSVPGENESIEFTVNCFFNESTGEWDADQKGTGTLNSAQKIMLTRRGLKFFNKSDTSAVWFQSGWDGDGTNGVSIDINSWQTRLDINDGLIFFDNTGSSGDGNPAHATSPGLGNVIYPKSIVKAWAQIETDTGGPFVIDGYNISEALMSYVGNRVQARFHVNMSDGDYAAVVSAESGSETITVTSNLATTGFQIEFFQAGVSQDASTNFFTAHVVVLAQQNT
jgi:hypothetical protein